MQGCGFKAGLELVKKLKKPTGYILFAQNTRPALSFQIYRNGENRPPITDERVEFGKHLVEVQDFTKTTDLLRGIQRQYLKSLKKNRKMSTCNRLDLETLGSQPIMPKNLPRTSVGH